MLGNFSVTTPEKAIILSLLDAIDFGFLEWGGG